MNILWTGSRGFIAGYAIQKLLDHGHIVYGLDNESKYGFIEKSYDNHPNYHYFKKDCKSEKLIYNTIKLYDIDILVLGAAIIGGISLFHTLSYDLISENEKLTSAGFDAAIKAYKEKRLKKILVISSSMVFESATKFPTIEGHQLECSPPLSTYGFQKLSTEYFTKGAHEQYGLPYTIVRPFNCIGIGEKKALVDKEIKSGNIKLAMSHVVPDLVQKILKKQYPLHILGKGNQIRHYTYAGDLADGIYKAIFYKKSLNEDFNLSTNKGHSVLELAEIIWNKINPNKEFKYICDKPFKYDVQKRIPDTKKAKEILGFEAKTSLEESLDEIIPWVDEMIKLGGI